MAPKGCPINKNHAEILRSLCYLPEAERRVLLRHVDLKLIRCICECAYNILRGNVPLSNKHKLHLKSHVNLLRKLVRKGEKLEKKKRIIQRGGNAFLPALLIPIVTTVLSEILK